MAVLAFAGIGAAIGSGFAGISALGLSGAALGWSIGGMVGGLFGPSQKVQGPRLADLKLTASTYGAPIPYVFGHPRIGGQVIWGSDRREISTTTSRRAKGPKVKTTSFTYEIDLLIKLTCNSMAGIRKIFVNGELQWTAADDADFGSINASTALADRITVYPGGDDQLPDPTYEAAVGIGNAPAYRGSLTVMLEGLQLGNSGQIPNLTFEVAQAAGQVVQYSQLATVSGSVGVPSAFSTNDYTTYAFFTQQFFDGSAYRYGNVMPAQAIFEPGAGDLGVQGDGYAMWGRSDRPVILAANAAIYDSFRMEDLNTRVQMSFASPELPRVYVLEGDDLVVAASGTAWPFGTPIPLLRYELSSGGIAVASASIPEVRSMVIAGELLYVHYVTGNSVPQKIEIFDLETLTTTGEIIYSPSVNGGAEILLDEAGNLLILGETSLHRYDGANWNLVMSLSSGYGALQSTGNIGTSNAYYRSGSIYTTRRNTDGFLYVRVAWPALAEQGIPLPEVVEDMCVRAGVDAQFIDVSGLGGFVVRAWAITPSTTRAALDSAAQAYQFESSCSDMLRFVRLGAPSAVTIPFEDLGTASSQSWVEALPLAERNDIEIPAYVTVKYMNVINDYQDGAERSSRIATESDAEQFIEISMGLTPEEAKRTANFIANIYQASLTTVGPIAVQTKLSTLQPTDVVTLLDESGSAYRVRISKAEWASGILKMEGVFDNASAASGDAITDEDYSETSIIRAPSVTLYVLGDWPLFRDEDDNVGHYWAATGAGSFWPGAALLKSSDDVVFAQVSQIEEAGILGSSINALPNYTGPNIPDETSVLRVDVGLSTLSSISYQEQIDESLNAFMVGAECIIARVATYVSPGVYDLRGLLRGRKGTEWAMGSHVSGEPVTLIQPQGIRRVGIDLSELGIERFYRAVTIGRPLDSARSRLFANTGVSSTPYAATNLDAVRDGINVTVSWNRRTRLSQNWLLGNVPLGEAEQSWVIESYTDGTYTTIANTYTSATNSVTFANAGTMVYLRIYQLSDRVGRGYVLQGAI